VGGRPDRSCSSARWPTRRGERALVAIAFDNCRVVSPSVDPAPVWRAGYYASFWCSVVRHGNRGWSGGGGDGTWLAPPSALDWKYKWEDSHVAALPLTFYGSHVDPADPRVAVIPIKFGERRGRLRFWSSVPFQRGGITMLSSEVVWDD
jgi:hypothetical protein